MNKARKVFRNTSIRTKLLLYFLILILLPITTVGFLGSIVYTRSLENEANTHTLQMIDQVKKNVEFSIRTMEDITALLSANGDVLAFLGLDENAGEAERQANEAAVRAELSKYTALHPEISGILLVNSADRAISNEMFRVARDPLTQEFWYRAAMGSPDRAQLISKPSGRNVRTSQSVGSDDVVSIVRALYDPVSGSYAGVALIDMELGVIEQAIRDIKFGKSGFLYILDAAGEVVYTPVNEIVYRVRADWLTDSPHAGVVKTIGSARYQILFSESAYTNWKIVGVFSLNETLAEVASLRNFTLLITSVTLVVAISVALFFTSSIAKPLLRLRRLMKLAEGGDFTVHFQSESTDEIGQLGESFNTMIAEIQKLIDLVYAEQRSKREAELKILQAQIKPHFLYNTLDTIQWMAQARQAEDIVEIVGALTRLFRTGLSKGEETLVLAQELEHVESYMIIQKARYEDKFDYTIRCGEENLSLSVLKLILQPLVENSIYHGLKEKRGSGRILIDVARRDEMLVLSVTDDGAGLPPDKAAALADMLERNIPGGKPVGYGIFNVHERIRLSFGPPFGLRFTSVPGVTTTFEIWHPLLER